MAKRTLFTRDEEYTMLYLKNQIPELKNDTDRQWRQYFYNREKDRPSEEEDIFQCSEAISVWEFDDDCRRMVYSQMKARIFRIIELQFDEGKRLELIKNDVEEVISDVTRRLGKYIVTSLTHGHVLDNLEQDTNK